jgi:hypothetical protein
MERERGEGRRKKEGGGEEAKEARKIQIYSGKEGGQVPFF